MVFVPPSLPTTKGMFILLRVNLHDKRSIKASAIGIATTKVKKDKIVCEDPTMDTTQISWPLVPAERKALTLP